MRKARYFLTRKCKGAAILVFTLVLVTLSTLIILFAAEYGKLQDQSMANINRNNQAFEAAQAGLEYAINYLKQNDATILAGPVGGYIPAFSNSQTTNVTLGNGSKYTFTYTNPVANNYTLIKITSTGTSDDASATRVVSQLVKYGSVLVNPPALPLTAKGTISLSGNSQIVNTYSGNTVLSGSTVSLSGSSSTVLSSGTSSTPGNIRSDIQGSSGSISGLTDNSFFESYFGNTPANVKSGVGHYYSNSSDTNYQSILSGMTGTSIWIDQTNDSQANFNGNITIGSATDPVLLIINGDARFNGNVTIYGYVFIFGDSSTTLIGNTNIIGGFSTTGQLSASGSIQVNYSPSTLSNLQNNSSMKYYAKVPGSWKDY